MKLKEILKGVEVVKIIGRTEVKVKGIKIDTKSIEKGDLFVCLRGSLVDSHAFSSEIKEYGAAAVIVEEKIETSIPQMVKTLGPHLQALHIHDNNKLNDNHWLPYEMDIDFTAAAKALKEIGYKGEFTMEADAYPTSQTDIHKALKDMAVAARRFADEFESIEI